MKDRFAMMLAAIAGGLSACGELAPVAEPPAKWSGDVSAVLARCTECHQETSSFFELATTCGEDGAPWMSPGDASSPVLEALSRSDHAGVLTEAEVERVRSWIVDEELTFASTRAHPAGWSLDHAKPLDPRPCFSCHKKPADRDGAIECSSCHEKVFGLDRCDNCHDHRTTRCGSPAEQTNIALHQVHAAGGRDGTFPPAACADCHRVPTGLLAAGHFDDHSPRAEVIGALAYDAASKSCTAPACHAARPQTWDTPSGDRCSRCHGAPPPDHASDRCDDCHRGADHANRELDVGVGCNDCHRADLLSGAHRSHLTAGAFRGAIGCESCHRVPAERDAPGHIDSALPAEVNLSGDDATFSGVLSPRFEPAGSTCADVGCHGATLDGGAVVTDLWTSGSNVECGGCHALPPLFVRDGAAVHLPTADTDCGICHRTPEGARITDGARAISEAGRSVHANGRVDVAEGL